MVKVKQKGEEKAQNGDSATKQSVKHDGETIRTRIQLDAQQSVGYIKSPSFWRSMVIMSFGFLSSIFVWIDEPHEVVLMKMIIA